jgi:hypothetical protein
MGGTNVTMALVFIDTEIGEAGSFTPRQNAPVTGGHCGPLTAY